MTERCDYLGGGAVRCTRERGHPTPHLYRCSGRYCPGLPWIASNTPHPTSCALPMARPVPETITDHVHRLRLPLVPKL